MYQPYDDLDCTAIMHPKKLHTGIDLQSIADRSTALLRCFDRERESFELYRDVSSEQRLNDLIVEAMQHTDLSLAGDLAAILAMLQRGSRWYWGDTGENLPPIRDAQLSLPKLRHDIDQFRYLHETGILDDSFKKIIQAYIDTTNRLTKLGHNTRVPLTAEDEQILGDTYGRIIHLASAPRLDKALSDSWNPEEVQYLYQTQRPGVVIIDDFLTKDALNYLYNFCLESTVWSGNRYANGRLGAFFFSGFNCPLLLQIAEEIRDALPELIGLRNPLRQLWGFKNTCALPENSTIHADFAAVNVNFWLTPTEANLDNSSGGMRIYDVDAPLSWDFTTYNERIDLIREFLSTHQHKVIRVPYKQNRAIIFNSDLFHATESVHFRPEYQSHRINITMLYGERRLDEHYPPSTITDLLMPSSSQMWRSSVFTKLR